MKKLIIVRHGRYDEGTGHLDEDGRRQMIGLAAEIAPHISGTSALILFSTKHRAVQSAEILKKLLKLESEAHDVLISSGGYLDRDKALAFVRHHKERVDILILVTHLEYGEYLPGHFGEHELGLKGPEALDGYGICKGQAWLIDCEARKMSRLVSGV